MKALVLGGTRFFGKPLVRGLLAKGDDVTLATRGRAQDDYGDAVSRVIVERTDGDCLRHALGGTCWDVIVDNLCYAPDDLRALIDNVSCKRYIMTSSTAVYDKHIDTKEKDFDPLLGELSWGSRAEFAYDEGKRQAERALVQRYGDLPAAVARFPFVLGEDDYTRRLYFYTKHIISERPMYIDRPACQMAFVRAMEAGSFLAFLAHADALGAYNGASEGTASIGDIVRYVAKKTGKEPIYSPYGDPAPYNGENEYSINTDRAKALGFDFTPLSEWLEPLLSYDIRLAQEGKP